MNAWQLFVSQNLTWVGAQRVQDLAHRIVGAEVKSAFVLVNEV